MRISSLIFGMFCIVGPLLSLLPGMLTGDVKEWGLAFALIGAYVIGLIPAALTGMVCASIYHYSWTKNIRPNIIYIAVTTTICGFIFSYFPLYMWFEKGAVIFGYIGASSAFICSFISAFLFYDYKKGFGDNSG